MLAYLQRSKHLWCLISKHKATFFADAKQARDRSQDSKEDEIEGFASISP
jgi:hypothetical protein